MANISECHFSSLPKTLQQSVFSFLTVEDHARVVRTCKTWNQVSKERFASSYSPYGLTHYLPAERRFAIRNLSMREPVVENLKAKDTFLDVCEDLGLTLSEGQVTIRELASGEIRAQIECENQPVLGARFHSPDHFITIESNSTLTLWDIKSGKSVWSHVSETPLGEGSVGVGRRYLSLTHGDSVELVDFHQREVHSFPKGPYHRIIGFSKDRIFGHTASDAEVDLVNFNQIHCLDTHGKGIWKSGWGAGFDYTQVKVLWGGEDVVVVEARVGNRIDFLMFDINNGKLKGRFSECSFHDLERIGRIFNECLAIFKSDELDIWYLPSLQFLTKIKYNEILPHSGKCSVHHIKVTPEKIHLILSQLNKPQLYSVYYDHLKPKNPVQAMRIKAYPLHRAKVNCLQRCLTRIGQYQNELVEIVAGWLKPYRE